MTASRARILSKVRSGLRVTGGEAERTAAVEARLAAPARNTVPSRAGGTDRDRRALFASMLEEASASVETVAGPAAVAAAVAGFLKRHNLPQSVRMGADPLLAGLDWSAAPHLEKLSGPALESDQVGLAAAFAGIAETGTLMLTSGPDNPTTNNFLPENHVVVLPASSLLGSYEDAWDALRAATGRGSMPRAVNYVSGPSRTGDIEQTILLGAHGPRRLHVVVVEGI